MPHLFETISEMERFIDFKRRSALSENGFFGSPARNGRVSSIPGSGKRTPVI
ncbi:hypothetical protein [Azospirillum largimobile]